MLVDLHFHTCFSDGTMTPEEAVQKAAALSFGVLAAADHNTDEGWPRFSAACRELGIHTVLMAFDMDMYENPAVANCFQTIRGILLEEGFQVKQITWDRAFKGIDDYLKGQIIRPN